MAPDSTSSIMAEPRCWRWYWKTVCTNMLGTQAQKGDDEPARLDLVLTLNSLDIRDITHERPLGASDHVVLSFKYIRVNNGE